MTDYVKKFMPRFRYGVIQPRAHEDVQRGRSYQLYRLLPLDFMEISTGLGLENYTEEGVEKAIKNYWTCVDRLAKEKVDHIIFSGAPISAVLTRPRVIELLHQTKERTGISADAPLEALIAALKHLGLNKLAIGSRWADPVNNAIIRYLEGAGIKVVGITKRNSVGVGFFRHDPGAGLGNGSRCGTRSGKNMARSRGYFGARGRCDGTARHPGLGRRIRQTDIYQYER